jgi:hypothetical protein
MPGFTIIESSKFGRSAKRFNLVIYSNDSDVFCSDFGGLSGI